MRALSLDSAEHGAFEAWEVDAASAAAEVVRLAHVESPMKRMTRRESGSEHL